MKKYLLVPLALIMVVALVLAGCAAPTTATSPTATTTAPPSPTGTTTAPPKPTGTTTAPPSPTATAKPITLMFNGAQFAANTVPGMTYNYFCDQVAQKSNGRIKFNFVGGGALTKPGEELTALQTGLVDVGAFSMVYFPTQMYINSGFNRALPFDTTDVKIGTDVMYKLYYDDPDTSKILQGEFEKVGMKFLTMTVDDSYVIETKATVATLDDIKGKKLAVLGYEGKFFGPTGATVIGMPVGDRPTALQTGVIDGCATPFEISAPFKLYEFAPYMIQSGLGVVTGNAIMWNTAKFNALPKDLQDIIVQVGKDAFKNNAIVTENWYKGALEARAKATGNKPYLNFSEADLAKWAGLVGEPVVDFVKASPPGVTGGDVVVQKYIELLKAAGVKFPKEWKVK